MKQTIYILVFLLCANACFAIIPLFTDPSWTSSDNDYSTGGALYDITMDGWIDYCTGNGNDMASNTNALYLNQNGALEISASWRSVESGYFSHIYIGDVDNDGDPDMAVSYLGAGSPEQGPTSIYRNNGAGLDTAVWWVSNDEYNSFDCAFGDVDLDGDLDLAVAAGDEYSGLPSPARVYRNNGGVVEVLPYWTSTDSSPGDACRWADIDDDGYLDLVVGYRHKFAVFSNNGGILEQNASWSAAVLGWVLRIAVGDYDKDGWKDIAIACNGQLGSDESSVEIFHNNGGTLESSPAFRVCGSTNYWSCVEWGDPNNNGWLDLAAGGWWAPPVVFENTAGILDTFPDWTGNVVPVCESVFWGDVTNFALSSVTEYRSGDGVRKLFYFSYQPIQSFQEIRVGGSPVPISDYCFDPLTGWISLKDAPPPGTDNIEIQYTHSYHPSLGVTNWSAAQGNYLFSNSSGISEEIVVHPDTRPISLLVYPNPFFNKITLALEGASENRRRGVSEITVYDISGRMVRQFPIPNSQFPVAGMVWDGCDERGEAVPAGLYIVEMRTEGRSIREKITKLK